MDEDDGQVARELVPVDEAFMRKDDDEGTGATLGLEQKCKRDSQLAHNLVEALDKKESCSRIDLRAGETCKCRARWKDQEKRGKDEEE